VQKYIDDPWCGFAFSNGLSYGMARGINEMIDPQNQALVPKTLPVLIMGGAMDPVGAYNGEQVLAERFRDLGIQDVQLILYPQGRHEMLNETNRDEVHADLVRWLDEHL
jgi:alpha-beta hydrolase superfamily lysophospholipase